MSKGGLCFGNLTYQTSHLKVTRNSKDSAHTILY